MIIEKSLILKIYFLKYHIFKNKKEIKVNNTKYNWCAECALPGIRCYNQNSHCYLEFCGIYPGTGPEYIEKADNGTDNIKED